MNTFISTDEVSHPRRVSLVASKKRRMAAQQIAIRNSAQRKVWSDEQNTIINGAEALLEQMYSHMDTRVLVNYDTNSAFVKVMNMCRLPMPPQGLKPIKKYCKKHNMAIEIKDNYDVYFRLQRA